jgi:hypothetical protein
VVRYPMPVRDVAPTVKIAGAYLPRAPLGVQPHACRREEGFERRRRALRADWRR